MSAQDNILFSSIPVTPDNKQCLIEAFMSMYAEEGCGICEEKGAEVTWFSPFSRCAHAKCVKQIEVAESQLVATINELFKDSTTFRDYNLAHMSAIEAVSAFCEGMTILKYLSVHGTDKLKTLFDTYGIFAAMKYAAYSRLIH